MQTFLFYVNSGGGLAEEAATRLLALETLCVSCSVAVELSQPLTDYPLRRIVLQKGRWVPTSAQPQGQNFFRREALQAFLEWSLSEFSGTSMSLVFASHGLAGRRIESPLKVLARFMSSCFSCFLRSRSALPKAFEVPALFADAYDASGSLYVGELATAIDRALNGKGKLQLIAFDACGMGTIESVDALRACAEVIVGSGMNTVALDWVTWIKNASSLVSGEHVAEALIKTYKSQPAAPNEDISVRALSAFDSTKAEPLIKAINQFAERFGVLLESESRYREFNKALQDYADVGSGFSTREIRDIAEIGRRMFPSDTAIGTALVRMESLANSIVISGFSNGEFSLAPRIFFTNNNKFPNQSAAESALMDYLNKAFVPFSSGEWGELQKIFFYNL
jgi:hypothetical protein